MKPALGDVIAFRIDNSWYPEEEIAGEIVRAYANRPQHRNTARVNPEDWRKMRARLGVPGDGSFVVHCPTGAISIEADEGVGEGVAVVGRAL